jgi:hypothetical protein
MGAVVVVVGGVAVAVGIVVAVGAAAAAVIADGVVASLQSSVPRPPPSSRLTIRDPQKRRDTC